MNFNIKQKDQSKSFEEFLMLVSKLNAVEFLGLTKILCVPLLDGERDRDFADLLDDVLDRFENAVGRNVVRFFVLCAPPPKTNKWALLLECPEFGLLF